MYGMFTGLRTFYNNSTVDVTREKENGSDASVATSIRDQYRVRHGSTCCLLSTSRERCLRSNGTFGDGSWTRVTLLRKIRKIIFSIEIKISLIFF